MATPGDAEVLVLIKATKRRYGSRLFGGNCGQFAFGLAKFLKDKGMHPDPQIGLISNETNLDPQIGLISNETNPAMDADDDTAKVEDELEYGEPDIYHAFLQLGQVYYDATGRIDNQYLIDFAAEEYGDDAPILWNELLPNERTRRIISFNTNWNLEWTDFYRFFEGDASA